MTSWFRRRIINPILALLRQGATPEKIALSIALGLALGVVPMLGTTSILCFLAALALRLNQPAIQLVNYLVYPLQIALLVPFLRAGEWLFNARPLGLGPTQILTMIRADVLAAIVNLWSATMHALVIWLLVAPLLVAGLYPVLAAVLRAAKRRMTHAPEATSIS